MEPVVPFSLADNDLYKYTMAQAIYHQYPGVNVRYKFKCRNHEGTLGSDLNKLETLCDMVNYSLDLLCRLQHTNAELSFLYNIRYIKPDFVDFLSLLKLNRDHINCSIKNGELNVNIEGPWIFTIWFEVLVLSIISETYTRLYRVGKQLYPSIKANADSKFNYLKGGLAENDLEFKFTDFSTRRRSSYDTQDYMIGRALTEVPQWFAGTSNVHFAMKYDIPVFGTMAHEWICAHQQLGVKVIDSQKAAFSAWLKEYHGDLGIALTDTVGFAAFIKDFDLLFAKVFDGGRHDSGNPFYHGMELVKHYKNLGIDPRTKSIIFSDGLDFKRALDIYYYFKGVIKTGFGIGTNFGNDTGLVAPQIVIKMVECNGKPVAKVSNDPGKAMCEDKQHENWVKHVFNINN
jgi:nicotinate phosphoribosyltransferase